MQIKYHSSNESEQRKTFEFVLRKSTILYFVVIIRELIKSLGQLILKIPPPIFEFATQMNLKSFPLFKNLKVKYSQNAK